MGRFFLWLAGVAAADMVRAPDGRAAVVEVIVLMEAGCPFCQQAIAGPLDTMVRAVGSSINVKQHPFGNSYYATDECGGAPYDSDVRHCWAAACVADSEPTTDCFTGELVKQHGQSEGDVDRMEACAISVSANWTQYWPFLVCMEAQYETMGLNATARCSEAAALDAAKLNACYFSTAGDAAVLREAKATFDHPAAPSVYVAGALVEADDALATVCAALQDRPSGCDGL